MDEKLLHELVKAKSFFGLATTQDLNKAVALLQKQINDLNQSVTRVNAALVSMQNTFKKNDLLHRVQELEVEVAKLNAAALATEQPPQT